MKKIHKLIFVIGFVFVIFVVPVLSQSSGSCSDVIEDVLLQVPASCDNTGRNQMCYGNPNIIVESQPDVVDFQFSAIGDIEDVIKLQSLRLSGMDTNISEWGIALMRLQTNLPDTTPGQNVTFLLFGDTELQPAYVPAEIPITVIAEQGANVRLSTTTGSDVVGFVGANESLMANGINWQYNWLRVTLPDGSTGWIAAFLVRIDGDESTLNVVSPDDSVFAPMQVMYFRSGIGDRQCNDAPDSGMLIQHPKGSAKIKLQINEVTLTIGSTVFVQADAGGQLYIYVLEGEVDVTASSVTRIVPEGAFTTVPLNDALKATDQPDDIQPYVLDDLLTLPIQLLPDEITIAEPLTESQLEDLTRCHLTTTETINIRRGPGTVYSTTNVPMSAGDERTAEGEAVGTDGYVWYKLTGERWVRSDLVTTNGSCDDLPTIEEIPPAPTAVPVVVTENYGSESATQSTSATTASASSAAVWNENKRIWFEFAVECGIEQIEAGDSIQIGNGGGVFPTVAEAEAGYAGSNATIILDGQPLSIEEIPIYWFAGDEYNSQTGYGKTSFAKWVAISGTHTLVGYWTHWGGGQNACTFTVP